MGHDSGFDVARWFGAFVHWMRTERAAEAIEILSDCSNELYLNSLTAWHLRRHGRECGLANFWARCEWEKVDVCYGRAKAPFPDWNRAWEDRSLGGMGTIEGKVLYWHYAESRHAEVGDVLRAQLVERRQRDRERGFLDQAYHGLVWLLSYAPASEPASLTQTNTDRNKRNEWADWFAARGLHRVTPALTPPEPGFFHEVGSLDLTGIWPLQGPTIGTLFVALCRFDDPGASEAE